MLYKLPTTSMMVVVSGKVVYSYGDIGQISYLASARKSILSMLYGKYVANGTINLDRTLGELDIDDDGGLLPIEKTARVRDLLTASRQYQLLVRAEPGKKESSFLFLQ